MVRGLSKREFGTDYASETPGNILLSVGLPPQRSLVRAYEQNPEVVPPAGQRRYRAVREAPESAGGSLAPACG
jgi:hypothetical protein